MENDISYVNCAAHMCPCLGVMTRSTTGSKEWYCSIHFGAPATRWSEITGELLRLKWLVDITRRIRAGRFNVEEVNKEMALNQCNYLQMQESEYAHQWLIRLEGVLTKSCKPRQQDLTTPEA